MNYYAVERSGDHLTHYGIKGMKWGVRKAVILGDQKKLDKHYKKAAKKLNKLADKALRSEKYAAKAAVYGTAAAGTGALAIGNNAAAKYLQERFMPHSRYMAAYKVVKPYKNTSKKAYEAAISKIRENLGIDSNVSHTKLAVGGSLKNVGDLMKKHSKKIRVGAGIASAGLGALAAKNAYIAANGRKYLDKADTFRREMDEAFSGTKYQGQYAVPLKQRKKRRNQNG